MELQILSSRLVMAGLFVCLAAAGSGRAGDQVPAATSATSSVSTTASPTSPVASTLPRLSAGLKATVYANVAEPMKLSFAPDGALYVGRQGGNDRIHRVAPGGLPVSEFGPPMVDPDAVVVDTLGRISGIRNSVLVGGGGILAAIFPNQTSTVVFNSGFADVDDMKFDRRERLVFSDDLPQVLTSNGNVPAVLFSTPSRPGSIAIDNDERIFVALADGTIRIYASDGSLVDGAFATGLAGLDTYLAFGPGPFGFGKALYVLNGSELLRFNRHGKRTTIGTGFSIGPSSGTGFVFGPDQALYVSEYSKNRILRISRAHGHRNIFPEWWP